MPSTANATARKSGGKKMKVGVHQRCTLSSVEIKETNKGNKLVEAIISNQLGEIMNKGIWIPDPKNPKIHKGEGKQDAIEREERNFVDECFELLTGFMTPEEASVEADTNLAFAKKVVAKLKGQKGLVSVIVQWDWKDEWPEFPKYRWIQRHIEGVPPIKPTKNHRMTKKVTSEHTNPETGESNSDIDDLPF